MPREPRVKKEGVDVRECKESAFLGTVPGTRRYSGEKCVVILIYVYLSLSCPMMTYCSLVVRVSTRP